VPEEEEEEEEEGGGGEGGEEEGEVQLHTFFSSALNARARAAISPRITGLLSKRYGLF